MGKRLYKSRHNSRVAGVCGGIGDFFGIDPTMVRLAWVLFAFFGGSGILAYIIAAIIIPTEPVNYDYGKGSQNEQDSASSDGWK